MEYAANKIQEVQRKIEKQTVFLHRKNKYLVILQSTGSRLLGTGSVKICTKASVWQSPLDSISEGGALDFIVIFS